MKTLTLMALILVLIHGSSAIPCIGGCGDAGNWEASAQSFLNSDIPGTYIQSTPQNAAAVSKNQFANGRYLKSLLSVSSSDVVVDASNGDGYSKWPHVKGAIHLPSKSLLYEIGTLRPASELARILGQAGITRDDRVVVYGNDTAPGDATFVFWVMRYLGHDDVRVLDGSLGDWRAASLPLESGSIMKSPTIYKAEPKRELLANYDYVAGKGTQIVDARAYQEYGRSRIPGAIPIDPEHVLDAGKVKDPATLNDTFSSLNRDKPVVVYSEDGLNASIVWFALQLVGYDSRLYTWEDWIAHLPAGAEALANRAASTNAGTVDMSRYKKLGR